MKTKRRFRHTVVFFLLKPVFLFYFKIFYRFKTEKFKPPKDLKGPYLVIGNHSTAFDGFFMAFTMPGPLYFVVSDMLMSIKYLSKVMKFLIGPIAKSKYRSDMETIRDMKRIISEGGNIGLFPEGNSTFSGELMPMPFVIAKLIKKFQIPVVFYTVEGGYLSKPRWSRHKRRGRIQGRISRVWRPEAFKDLTAEEIYTSVRETLTVDEFKGDVFFKSKRKAEDLESAYFICPSCGAIETLVSSKDDCWCEHCDFHVRMNAYGHFENMGGTSYHETTVPWYHDQLARLERWLGSKSEDALIFENAHEKVLKVERSKNRHFVGHATMRLYKDHMAFDFESGERERFELKDINCAVQQKNKLIIHNYALSKTYFLLSHPKRNALKYTLAIDSLKNSKELD